MVVNKLSFDSRTSTILDIDHAEKETGVIYVLVFLPTKMVYKQESCVNILYGFQKKKSKKLIEKQSRYNTICLLLFIFNIYRNTDIIVEDVD